jgi:DNA ligase (NAD+)
MAKLKGAGVNTTEPRQAEASGTLQGTVVVLTGTFPTLSRAAATDLVERAGGRVTSSVSKATTFVVAGEDAGSKLEKARALGIEVIDEVELRRRAEEGYTRPVKERGRRKSKAEKATPAGDESSTG